VLTGEGTVAAIKLGNSDHHKIGAKGGINAAYWGRNSRVVTTLVGCKCGIVSSQVSGVVVLDAYGPEARKTLQGMPLPSTPCVLASKGMHYHFRSPGSEVQNFVKKLPGLDFRGMEAISWPRQGPHPSGLCYRWAEY